MVTLQDIAIAVVIVAVVVAVPIVMVSAFNRGNQLKCPKCGSAFKAPFFDQKMIGYGWTFPYLGNVECPHCHTVRSRRSYSKVKKKQAPVQENN